MFDSWEWKKAKGTDLLSIQSSGRLCHMLRLLHLLGTVVMEKTARGIIREKLGVRELAECLRAPLPEALSSVPAPLVSG